MKRLMSAVAWLYRGVGLLLLVLSIVAAGLFYVQDAALIKQGASVAAFVLSAVLVGAGELIGYLAHRSRG